MRKRGLRWAPLVLAAGALMASAQALQAQYQVWCVTPFPPCNPEDPASECYRPPDPDERCEPEECEKCKRSPCYVGTGSYGTAAVDLNIRTTGFPLSVARRYDSTYAIDGPLGFGWTSSLTPRLYYAVYLYVAPSSYQKEAYVIMPDGARYRYVDTGSSFTPPLGRKDVLVRNPDETFTLTLQRTRSVLSFGTDGALFSMKDDYGNTITYTYVAGRVQQIADSAGSGRSLTVNWGPDGRIATVQDSTGRLVQYGYTPQGSLQTVTDPANRVTTYSYQNGRFAPLLNQIKDHWNRVITDITWDTKDRVATYTDQGETYTYTYAYGGNPAVTAKTDSVGNRWLFPFTAGGLISDATPPSGGGGPTHTEYYPDGLVQQFIDSVGVKAFYTYNAQGNPLSITRDYQGPTAIRFDYTYDVTFPEKVTSVTPRDPATNEYDSTWQAWRYDYHLSGSPAPGALHHVYRVQSDGLTLDTLSTYEYDTKGRLTRETSATGGITDYTYDAAGDLLTVTMPGNNDVGTRPGTTYAHDALGRLTSAADPLGHVTTYSYDLANRITEVTIPKPSPSSPLTFRVTYSYDNYDAPLGLVFMDVTDLNGRVSKYGRDQFGRNLKVINPLSNTTTYSYTRDRLAALTDANGNITSYAYDTVDRLVSTTFPGGGMEYYSYTADGLLYQETDRRNQTITYSYDRHKRLSQRSYPNSTSIQYTYMGARLTQIVDSRTSPAETHLFTYDASHRVSSTAQGGRGTVTYQYNAMDEPLAVAIQGGPATGYTYYADGSLNTITWTPLAGEFKWRYTLVGQYESIGFPNGQTRNYTYDDQGRLLQLANLHPNIGNLATYFYTYDLNHGTATYDRLGQRVSMSASVPAQGLAASVTTYEFDPVGHLTKATYPSVAPFNGETQSWAYDAIGNRTSQTINGVTRGYTYQHVGTNPNAWERLLNDGLDTFTYDDNGNTLTRSGATGSVSLAWDTENRTTSISGIASASYAYDYAGRRSRATLASTTTFLYDGQHIIQEQGASATSYLYGPGLDEPLAMASGSDVYYYVVDAVGSISLLVNASGAALNSYVYDAWGNVRSQSGGVANRLGYTARETEVAGLLFYRARYYQPSIGRFASADPMLRFQKAWAPELMYSYADSSPVLLTDPLGLYQKCQTYEHESFRLIDTDYYRTPWYPVDQFSPGAGSPSPLGGSSAAGPAARRGGNNPRGMRPNAGGSGAGGAATSGAVFVQACLWQRVTTLTFFWEVTKWSQTCCWDTCEPGSTECTPPSKYVYGRIDTQTTTDQLTTKGWRVGPFFKICDDPRQPGSGL